jgi:hypothetical protein
MVIRARKDGAEWQSMAIQGEQHEKGALGPVEAPGFPHRKGVQPQHQGWCEGWQQDRSQERLALIVMVARGSGSLAICSWI